jgi:hypothetical protein
MSRCPCTPGFEALLSRYARLYDWSGGPRLSALACHIDKSRQKIHRYVTGAGACPRIEAALCKLLKLSPARLRAMLGLPNKTPHAKDPACTRRQKRIAG